MNRIIAKYIFCAACSLIFMWVVTSCSVTKFVPEEHYLLHKVKIKTDDKALDLSLLQPYIRQQANSKWFSLFRVPLGAYSLAGDDTTKWVNRTLRNIGEEPVLYDTLQANLTRNDLLAALQNMGFMNADVDVKHRVKGKKLTLTYELKPGIPFFIFILTSPWISGRKYLIASAETLLPRSVTQLDGRNFSLLATSVVSTASIVTT